MPCSSPGLCMLACSLLVEFTRKLLDLLIHGIHLLLDGRSIILILSELLLKLIYVILNLIKALSINLSFHFLEQDPALEDKRISLIDAFNLAHALLVFICVSLCFLLHPLDFLVRKLVCCSDFDALLLAGPQVLGRDVDDAVCVNVKGNLNLRDASYCRRDAHKVESAKRLVVNCHRTLALQDVAGQCRLIVRSG